MKKMKLFKQKSTILPDLKFKKIIKLDENQAPSRLFYNSKNIFNKDNENLKFNSKDYKNKEKNENDYMKTYCENKKRSASNKIMNDKEKSDNFLKELKEEVEILKNKLNDEKLKSEVLREIAEEEQRKHIMYKKKYQTIIFSKGELIDEIKNNSKIIQSYKEGKDELKNNKNIFKNLNICYSVRSISNNINNSDFNNCFTYSRQNYYSPNQTIQVNKNKMIKKYLLNKKIKIIHTRNNNEEIKELKSKNIEKDKLIEELKNQVAELEQKNIKILNKNKISENNIIKLKEEINMKKKELESLKLKFNEEKDINQKYMNQLRIIKNENEVLIIKLKYEKEQNEKLKIKLNINKNKKNYKNENNFKNSFENNTKKSLEMNELKDISNISSIENKQQIGQNEQEDMTLKEIFQNNY